MQVKSIPQTKQTKQRPRVLLRLLAVLGFSALSVSGCSLSQGGEEEGFRVYATTGYLADAVKNIALDAIVTTMVGPGGDPHTFQPSTRDIEHILNADLVLWNGLHLEAHMIDQLESLEERQLAVGEFIPKDMLLLWPNTEGATQPLYDPHIWNSPEIWSMVIGLVTEKLVEANPERAIEYRRNAEHYLDEIYETNQQIQNMMARIPANQRILITGHDAFNYFGEAYQLEVYATDFVSTDAALSPQELSHLATLIVEHRVPVIFQDNQANPQAITSLREAVQAMGWEVTISDEELYADSLGAEVGVDTYLGVLAHNARAVAEALAGEAE